MTRELKRRIVDAIAQIRNDAVPGSRFDPLEVARAVVAAFPRSVADEIAIDTVRSMVGRQERKAVGVASSPSGWLFPLPPGFEHIPPVVQNDTLEQFRARTEKLAEQVEAYKAPRISPETLKQLAQVVREMKAFDPMITPFFAGNPSLTVGPAVGLYWQSIETPARSQRREAAKSARLAKKGRTQNQ